LLIILLYSINICPRNEFNLSGQILWVFTIFFGGLGIGSIWKPDIIGEIASELLKNMSKNGVETKSDSHNKQVQMQSPHGVQAMATQGGNVTINVDSEKKEQAQNLPVEEKEILRKETIVVSPANSYYYEFEFKKGDNLIGEISSNSPIDIYFVDDFNFDKWNRDKSFDEEYSNEGVLGTNIDYLVPTKGTWYLIIENKGRKSATVKVLLY